MLQTNTHNMYQVDAFASVVFKGNPAAVLVLEDWFSDETMLSIAQENNLSETAYFIDKGEYLHLRWFTPAKEVRLCGHATLASAYVLYEHLAYQKPQIHFKVLAGDLYVNKQGTSYQIDFPADQVKSSSFAKSDLESILQCEVLDIKQGTDDVLVQVKNEEILGQLKPNFRALADLEVRGLIATTRGTQTDVASRGFYPAYGIEEDPVTGSAHASLIPYWSKKLHKQHLIAKQLSARAGDLICDLVGDRVHIAGNAVLYLKGKIYI